MSVQRYRRRRAVRVALAVLYVVVGFTVMAWLGDGDLTPGDCLHISMTTGQSAPCP